MKKQIEGTDASIETSLKEYGVAWIEHEKSFQFIYGIAYDGQDYSRFDHCSFGKDTDCKVEFDWIDAEDWDSFLDSHGVSSEEWNAYPLPHKISDLIRHWGFENICGSSYWEGMTYSEVRLNANSRWQKDID